MMPPVQIDLAGEVFDAIAGRFADRAETIALFAETDTSFEEWAVWEVLAAGRNAGWTVDPKPPYARFGVLGSRDEADLAAFDPARGQRVVVELAIVHDWSTNAWVDRIKGDADKLRRVAVAGVIPLQIVVAMSLASPIEVNATWTGWLDLTELWSRPTPMTRAIPIGRVGEMIVRGWLTA